MKQYLDFLQYILDNGTLEENRTKVKAYSTFGYQYRVDLQKGFPLLTTKQVHLKSIIYELLWFLKGSTNIKELCENNVRIWDDWPYEKYQNSQDFQGESIKEFAKKIKNDEDFAKKWGDLGPVYGYQWRHFESGGKVRDQITWVINEIKTNPRSRRLIVSAWNPARIDDMALPPCHAFMQFYVGKDNRLSLQLYQRSADAFLGVPFNLASYALLLMMVADVCNLECGEFIHTFGDCHIYENHLEQIKIQLARKPYPLPKMLIKHHDDIFAYKYEDFELVNYKCHPRIKGSVAV